MKNRRPGFCILGTIIVIGFLVVVADKVLGLGLLG